MIIRLSQKMAKKIKVSKLPEIPLDPNPYADWSGHLFTADRSQYIIFSNTRSLYSCLLFGRGITDDSEFIARSLASLREFIEDDGQAFTYQRFIAPTTTTVSFGKAFNRSVTGSINDLVQSAKIYLEDDLSPHDIGFKLNRTPLSALTDIEGRKYASPNEAFKLLASDPTCQK